VDIDSQTIQLPEELPSFPQRAEFVAELVELLSKYKISIGQVDRWVTRYSVCTHVIFQCSSNCNSCDSFQHRLIVPDFIRIGVVFPSP